MRCDAAKGEDHAATNINEYGFFLFLNIKYFHLFKVINFKPIKLKIAANINKKNSVIENNILIENEQSKIFLIS